MRKVISTNNLPNVTSDTQVRNTTPSKLQSRLGTSDVGMTRSQLLILIALGAIILTLSLPPYVEYNWKVRPADGDVDAIAGAIRKYYKHTGAYPQSLEDLISNPSIEGWKGRYLEDMPKTPWGGSYQILPDSYKVCISENHPRVPKKYKHGGIAEIGRVYLAGEEGTVYWWK